MAKWTQNGFWPVISGVSLTGAGFGYLLGSNLMARLRSHLRRPFFFLDPLFLAGDGPLRVLPDRPLNRDPLRPERA